MGNPFIHIELQTNNQAAAKQFYSQLLEWKFNDMQVPGLGNYTLLDVGGGTGGGIMTNPVPQAPSSWLAYVQVSNLDASTEKAQQLGARLLQPRTEVAGFGWFTVIQDPTGANVGLYEMMKR